MHLYSGLTQAGRKKHAHGLDGDEAYLNQSRDGQGIVLDIIEIKCSRRARTGQLNIDAMQIRCGARPQ